MQNDKTQPPGQVLQLLTSPNELWSGSFRDQDLGIAHAHCWWGVAATRRSKWTDTVHTHTHTHTFISMSISISICESEALLAQLCLTICDHVDCSHLAPLSMGFSRQERLSG